MLEAKSQTALMVPAEENNSQGICENIKVGQWMRTIVHQIFDGPPFFCKGKEPTRDGEYVEVLIRGELHGKQHTMVMQAFPDDL
mmetsp:Transcript_12806/g.19395  ORF Transcript_12806/g.19395 Transcript_12806/m.19395 type:complete len:84 (+) Transcript_12806:36-287(+)